MQSAECGIVARGNGGGGNAECGIGARGTINSGDAFLLRRFVVGLRLEVRFCCNAFHRFALGDAVLAGRFAIDLCHCLQFCCRVYRRFTPAVCLATNRTACGSLRFYSAGARTPFVRSRGVGAVICLCGFTSGLRVSCRRSRRVTGNTGKRGWRRGACASLRNRIGFEMLSAGSTLRQNVEAALRPPQTASKSRMWKRHCRLSGLSSHCGGLL